MKRQASAVWNGTVKEGSGYVTSESKALEKLPYSYHSRFENGTGTNPEELMAAAHAGCFTMQLSANLTEAGFTPEELETKCHIVMEDGTISKSELVVQAKVSKIDNDKFQEIAQDAKKNCPVSKAYKALDITLEAILDTGN